jgi:hypothetical protein
MENEFSYTIKKRNEGRKKWEKGLDNNGNIERISFLRIPPSARLYRGRR